MTPSTASNSLSHEETLSDSETTLTPRLSSTSSAGLKVVEDKAQRILEAAKHLFARFGIKKTSIEEIAHQAGLGKGTVYLYFKSKDEIFSVLASNFAKEFNDSLNSALSLPGSATEKLHSYVETRVNFWDRAFREYGMTAASVLEAQASSACETIRKQYGDDHIRVISEILEDGKANGEFHFENPTTAALGVYYILDSLTRPWNHEHEYVSAQDKIATSKALLFNGLSVRKATH